MRRRIVATLGIAWLLVLAIGPAAQAQRAPAATKEEIAALEQTLEELREQTVQVPTLSAAVEDLSARLAQVERQLQALEREQQAVPDALGRLDAVDEQVRILAGDIEALRTRLAGVEQPWSPPMAGGGVRYKDKGGFRWVTADDRYAIEIGGYMQGRYQLDVTDGEVDTSTFRLRRARLGISGHVGSEKMAYKLVLSAIKDTPALDYYVDYGFRDQIVVRFGQYKTLFTRNYMTSSRRLAYTELPLAVDRLRYDRDIQVGVHGLLGNERVWYYAGIGNGAGANRLDDNIDIAATVRADAVIVGERFGYGYGDIARTETPALMIGAGLVHDLTPMPDDINGVVIDNDVDGDGEIDNVRVISASVDAIVRYRGMEAAVEAVLRHEGFGTILEHPGNADLVAAIGEREGRTYLGLTGQLTYLLPRDVLVGVRASRSRVPFLGVGGRSSRLPRGEHVLELDGLVQLYSERGYRTVGLLYSFHDYSPLEPDAGSSRDHRLILEAQLVF